MASLDVIMLLFQSRAQNLVLSSTVSNNLEGPIPKELSQLTAMTYMESIGNAITGKIPNDLQKLTGLQTIVFAFNALTGTIPTWFNKLPKLECKLKRVRLVVFLEHTGFSQNLRFLPHTLSFLQSCTSPTTCSLEVSQIP